MCQCAKKNIPLHKILIIEQHNSPEHGRNKEL